MRSLYVQGVVLADLLVCTDGQPVPFLLLSPDLLLGAASHLCGWPSGH